MARTRKPRARRPYSSGATEMDLRLRALVEEIGPEDPQLTFEMLATVLRAANEPIGKLDRKMINVALKEMRYAFAVFARYRDRRKVTIFGSARVEEGDPNYEVAKEFGRLIAQQQWMVVTGAGPGIMQAGNEGAGQEQSFGVNIVLPFENPANQYIAGDPKLINFKYFFTRKLMFIKEADAFVLCPGGFGTMDELFELLTLEQTGKSDLHPIVMLQAPGFGYWEEFDRHIRDNIISRGYAEAADADLYHITDNASDAVRHIQEFYRVYHSQRWVGDKLILRLALAPDEAVLRKLSEEFSGILRGPVRAVSASPAEIRDDDLPDLPRIQLAFDRIHYGRLRQFISRLNQLAGGAPAN
ncbi:MAG: TIGR00730 family Rossman fold protein [Candidatus Dormiibacterota bacterium]